MPQIKGTKKRSGQAGSGFTRTLLAGFVIDSPSHDGSHAGLRFIFQGGPTTEGTKYSLDYADAGMTDDQSFLVTEVMVRRFRYPSDFVPLVCGLTFYDLAPDGTFREARITNNSGQYGERKALMVPGTRKPRKGDFSAIPAETWANVARDILARCVSPFGADEWGENPEHTDEAPDS